MNRSWLTAFLPLAALLALLLHLQAPPAQAQSSGTAHCEKLLAPMPGVPQTSADVTTQWMNTQLQQGRQSFVYGNGMWCAW